MESRDDRLRQALYDQVCESYHAVDDFRMKLLGLLPVATGTAVFLLLSGKAELIGHGHGQASDALLAIGAFGFLFTAGLFAYELFGIKKCHYLIVAGQRLETDMDILGQFRSRPRELAGFINEPYASAIIYPASMAAWAFLAFATRSATTAAVIAVAVFVVGYKATRAGARRIKENQEREALVLEAVGDRQVMLDDVRRQARRWESRHCRPPAGVKGWLHRLKARVIERLPRALQRRDWVDGIVQRLHARGDLDRDGELLLRRDEDAGQPLHSAV